MPGLILSPRYTPDSILLSQAAIQQNWHVTRLLNWHLDGLAFDPPVAIYGESLFVQYVAEQLSLEPVETPVDWLPSLPYAYTNRTIHIKQLGDLRASDFPAFMKSPNDKTFPAKVYLTMEDLSAQQYLPSETSILLSEPVHWEMEFGALGFMAATPIRYYRSCQMDYNTLPRF